MAAAGIILLKPHSLYDFVFAQYMSCAGAPIWCTAQAMPTTSDKYTLLTVTFQSVTWSAFSRRKEVNLEFVVSKMKSAAFGHSVEELTTKLIFAGSSLRKSRVRAKGLEEKETQDKKDQTLEQVRSMYQHHHCL